MNPSTTDRIICRSIFLVTPLLVASLLTGCGGSAKVTGTHELAPAPAGKPIAIYVTDFDLGAASIKHEDGMLGKHRDGDSSGPVRRIFSGGPKDSEARARQLVDLMAESLVKELNKAGFTAIRHHATDIWPAEGWLVRGVFTEVQEGNRLQRAVIGFGKGQTDLQVVSSIHNLHQGAPKPLYEIDTDATSSKGPGAAPMMAMNPYSAAVRFVMAGKDLDKNVKKTAGQIAAEISKRVQQPK